MVAAARQRADAGAVGAGKEFLDLAVRALQLVGLADPGVADIGHFRGLERIDAGCLVDAAHQARLVADFAWAMPSARPVRHAAVEGYADQPEAVADARCEQDVVFPERDHAVGAQFGMLSKKVLHRPERCRVIAGIGQDPVRCVSTAPVFRGVQYDQLAAQVPQPLERKSLFAIAGVDYQQVFALDIPGSCLARHVCSAVFGLRCGQRFPEIYDPLGFFETQPAMGGQAVMVIDVHIGSELQASLVEPPLRGSIA